MSDEVVDEVVGSGKWVLRGTEKQNAILRPVFKPGDANFIDFPWERVNNLPTFPVPITWEDLNGGGGTFAEHAAKEGFIVVDAGEPYPLNPHLIHGEEQGHAISRPSCSDGKSEARFLVAGEFWTDGRIKIDVRQESDPDSAREVLSAEIAHAVDYGLPLLETQKAALMRLLHGGGTDAHTWWERVNYTSEYYTLVGESWMALFTHTYSNMEPYQTPFVHKSVREMAPAVRQIVDMSPVVEPPVKLSGRIFHTRFHYTYTELTWSGAGGERVSIWRNGTWITTTGNDERFVNFLGWRHGSFSYVVIDSTGRRSNELTLTV